MGYLGRRIGKSQDTATDSGSGGGGGLLDLWSNGYFQRQGNIYNAPGVLQQGLTATGGVISDYTSGPAVYRAHIFTSSGTFDVSAIGDFGDTVEYLVVAGGGAAGGYFSAGGGAGGLRTNVPGVVDAAANPLTGSPFPIPSASFPAPYAVVVGAGGASTPVAPSPKGTDGGTSSFGPISCDGGGAGGVNGGTPLYPGNPGGSGGGSKQNPYSAGVGNQPTPYSPSQGYPGGLGNPGADHCGGGGGAGAAGEAGSPTTSGVGGAGVQVAIAGPTATTFTGVGALNPATSEYQWFAGGGAGGGNGDAGRLGGVGGGGSSNPSPSPNGLPGTGGGGAGRSVDVVNLGNGGSGIVVVRYQIGSTETGTAKATGGSVSFYDGRTIHTFTTSGTFTAPGTFNETITYVAVGGGGGGGVQHGGGGGAGGYTTADIPLNAGGSDVPVAIVIGAGGAGMTVKTSLAGTAGGPENNGNNTTIGFPSPVTAGYGGGGGQLGPPPGSPLGVGGPAPLGSGGGGGMKQPGITADNKGTGGPQGNNGGSAITYSGGGVGGGGGGAGAAGGDPSSPNPEKGAGGIGVQVHPYFRDPAAAPSATTPTEPRHSSERGGGLGTPGPAGQFYLAGGGGGGAHVNWPYSVGPNKWGADGGSGGGGKGGNNTPGAETQYHPGTSGLMGTGGGGGASGPNTVPGGSGGSGIVLIAYPT